MNSFNYEEILEPLHQRSKQDQVNWQPTANPKEFIVYFRDSSLSLRRDFDAVYEQEYISVTIRNSQGQTIDELWVYGSDSKWSTTESLYEAARGKALNIDRTFQEILNELETQKIIGQEFNNSPSQIVAGKS